MPSKRLIKFTADALECTPGKEKEIYRDTLLEGFGILVWASGKKRYVIETRKLGVGRYPFANYDNMSVEQARTEARGILADIDRGINPKERKKKMKEIKTFEEVANSYISIEVDPKKKESTSSDYKGYLKNHLLPALGKKRITDVTLVDVQRVHEKLQKTPYIANRLLAFISSMWNWAAKRGEVDAAKNPAKGIDRYSEAGRERYLTDEEFMRLGAALELADTEGIPWDVKDDGTQSKHTPKKQKTIVDRYAIAAIRLILFTGARREEILSLKWEHVDLEKGLLNLPDSKTGKKTILLNRFAVDILRSLLPAVDGNPYVIVGDKPGQHRADLKKPWENIRRAANLPNLRIHDLRHAFASVGVGASMGLPIVGKLLGHKNVQTTQKYGHLDANPVRTASNAIGELIDAAMNPKKPEERATLGNFFD